MARNSIDDAIERRARERDVGGDRLVALRMDFELDGEILLSVGQTWDRRLGDFDGEAEIAVVVRIHPGQRAAVEWFARWLDEHDYRREHPPEIDLGNLDAFVVDDDPTHAYSAMFAGGRRGGKTWIAVALCVAYAIRYPNAIVWLGSPVEGNDGEIRRYAAGVIAAEWIDRETTADG